MGGVSMGDLDFLKDKDVKKTEIATSGSPKKVAKKKPVDTRIKPEVIQEARRLASTKGLEIDPFFTKHKISVEVDTLLYGELDKDGYLK